MKLREHLNDMLRRELVYAEELEELASKIRHPVLSVLFRSIALDSRKHSAMYGAIIQLLSSVQPLLSDEELDLVKRVIKRHIDLEQEMISFTKDLLSREKDPRVLLIVGSIHSDELVHHKILLDIQKNIAEKEIYTEEQLWDAIWKESPWHGAPGG